jgi:hypothetical protein
VCIIEEDALRRLVADEVGGSHRVELDEVQRTLTAVGEVRPCSQGQGGLQE